MPIFTFLFIFQFSHEWLFQSKKQALKKQFDYFPRFQIKYLDFYGSKSPEYPMKNPPVDNFIFDLTLLFPYPNITTLREK